MTVGLPYPAHVIFIPPSWMLYTGQDESVTSHAGSLIEGALPTELPLYAFGIIGAHTAMFAASILL
jgi:hypothetical protein